MPSDEDLLAAWVGGDQSAGNELFGRHYASVVRFFRAKGVAELEDLVQETFLGLSRSRAAPTQSVRAYLFGTARNVLRQYFRRRQRKEGNLDFGTCSVADLGPSPSQFLADQVEKRLLLEGLRRLAIDDQIVLELTLWESMTAVELGAVLDLTEAAVRSRLHRAKARLHNELESLAESNDRLPTTMSGLETWARKVRDELGPT